MKNNLIWLVSIAIGSFVGVGFLAGFDLNKSEVEIQLHDTYFVLSKLMLCVFMFLNLTFWSFLIRQIAGKFKAISANLILMISSGLLILITVAAQNLFISYIFPQPSSGWTVYPPLSATSNVTTIFDYSLKTYLGLQIIIVGLTGIMIGKQLKQAQ